MDYLRRHDPYTAWQAFLRPENQHPMVQLAKYVLFGVLAVVVHSVVFGLLAWSRLLPHLISQGEPVERRVLFFVSASTVAFLVANLFAYYTNSKWVFMKGRHHTVTEVALFTLVGSIGFIVGLAVGIREILAGSGGSWQASGALVVSATVVNFLTRKFVIFRR
jgi:putative flippase GtrA